MADHAGAARQFHILREMIFPVSIMKVVPKNKGALYNIFGMQIDSVTKTHSALFYASEVSQHNVVKIY